MEMALLVRSRLGEIGSSCIDRGLPVFTCSSMLDWVVRLP